MTIPAALIDELEFRSYVHNRKTFPDVEPERWALIFSNVPEMEERYLDMLSTGNILDVAPQGENDSRSECSLYQALNTGKGVSGFHGHHPTDAVTRPQERGIADSQILDRHGDDRFADNIQRALEGLPQNGDAEEEEAAAEEGAAIENSGYPDPAENVRFA